MLLPHFLKRRLQFRSQGFSPKWQGLSPSTDIPALTCLRIRQAPIHWSSRMPYGSLSLLADLQAIGRSICHASQWRNSGWKETKWRAKWADFSLQWMNKLQIKLLLKSFTNANKQPFWILLHFFMSMSIVLCEITPLVLLHILRSTSPSLALSNPSIKCFPLLIPSYSIWHKE